MDGFSKIQEYNVKSLSHPSCFSSAEVAALPWSYPPPTRVLADAHGVVWHKADHLFKQPRAFLYFRYVVEWREGYCSSNISECFNHLAFVPRTQKSFC